MAFIFSIWIQSIQARSSLASSFSVSKANNQFAVDLYRTLATKDGSTPTNLFFSPSSLSTVLAMTYLGARGNTATKIAKTLHWDGVPAEQLHVAMKEFVGTINAIGGGENKLLSANSLFVQQGLQIAQFKSDTSKFYGADVAQVDYKTNPEGARNQVNKWVEQKTQDKIKGIIPPSGFDANTRLVLVNAIYFKGFWEKIFNKKLTHDAPFTTSPSKKINMKMMSQTGPFKIIVNSKLAFETLELPYKDRKTSMFILLPQDPNGLPNLEKALTIELLEKTIAETRKSIPMNGLQVTIPKFQIAKSFELSQVLSELGADEMFSNTADFSGITQTEKLQVSEVIHKALVEVNEEGTEAAAASVVGMGRMAMPSFMADHPFLFLILDNKSGSILFMGRFANPPAV